MPEAPMVRVEGLHLAFDIARRPLERLFARGARPRVRAVRDVAFEIGRGRTFGLVGESGCGKSTVGRLMVGLYRPDAGRIEIAADGFDDTQMIFQDPFASLDPRWRVLDIVAEPIRARRLIRDRRALLSRVEGLLDLVGLSAADGAKFPHEFSGGQRQRIAIARALATNPRVLVCDEPTSALDVSVQAQILNLMKRLQAEFGLTYLFISHDLAVVTHMSHDVGVMYLGAMVEIAPVDRIFTRPLHPYTRMLLDAVPSVRRGKAPHPVPAGSVPNPLHPPPGCAFNPRCSLATDLCRREAPRLAPVVGGGAVACHAVGPELRLHDLAAT